MTTTRASGIAWRRLMATGLVLTLSPLLACAAEPYFLLKITQPDVGATVHDNEGKLLVGVVVAPPLNTAAGDRLALLVDGETIEQSQSASFELADVPRGTHTVRVEVRDGDSRVLLSSAPVTFYMWRASIHYGNRGQPGALPQLPVPPGTPGY
jgi:hypothetical protein